MFGGQNRLLTKRKRSIIPRSPPKKTAAPYPGSAATQDMYLRKHRSLESYNPLGHEGDFPRYRSSFRKASAEYSIPCWSAHWPCIPELPPPIGSAGIHHGFLVRHPFKSPFAPISQIAEGQLFEIWEYYLIFRKGWVGGWLLSGYAIRLLAMDCWRNKRPGCRLGQPGSFTKNSKLCNSIVYQFGSLYGVLSTPSRFKLSTI